MGSSGIVSCVQVRERQSTPSIGFGNVVRERVQQDSKFDNEAILKVDQSDLISYGLIPEFVGRFPVVAPLQHLTTEVRKQWSSSA